MCLLRRLPRCHYFVLLSGLYYGTDCSVLFWLSFTGAVLVSEISPRCLQLAVQKTNGCSVPAGLWAPYKNTFTPACYKHDFCYFCVRIACLVNTN